MESLRTMVDLPIDVLPLIFEYAAHQDRRSAARTLSLVNKAVKSWVEKIAYAVIVLRTGPQAHTLSETLKAHPHLSTLVHALALPDKWGPRFTSSMEYLLRTCTGITALYWNAYDDIHPETSPDIRVCLEQLPLKILYTRLLTFIDWGDPSDTPLEFSTGVTHLGLLDNWLIFSTMLTAAEERALAQGRWEGLEYLAVQVPTRAPWMSTQRSLYEKVLHKTGKLKALVSYVEEMEGEKEGRYRFRRGLDERGEMQDERLVVLERKLGVEEWLGAVEGWEGCDAFQAGRTVEERREERERGEREKAEAR